MHAGTGNIGSVVHVLRRLGTHAQVSNDPSVIGRATKLILPGVGAFDAAMERLGSGMIREALDSRVLEDRVPVLGICLGMQLMAASSEEGVVPGLGWIPGRVVRLVGHADRSVRLPHMGWNTASPMKTSRWVGELMPRSHYYFVHSFGVECRDRDDVLMQTTYGRTFDSAFERDNIVGVQFHPEKSHRPGRGILASFLAARQ